MKTDDIVIKRLSECDNPYDFLKTNSIFLNFGNKIELPPQYVDIYKHCLVNNKLFEVHKRAEIGRINNCLNNSGILPVFFKGSILAEQLYDKFYYRETGDIDFWVKPDDFECALNILYSLGYSLYYENGLEGEHHVVLKSTNFVVELHKNILNPFTLINEEYLIKNIKVDKLGTISLCTFSVTATLIHLLYHLYMDSWSVSNNFYSVLTRKTLPKTNRFFYRAYEISLYSENYFTEINWREIEEDIVHQKLHILFKKMILDILEIFPNALPMSFVDTVRKINYVEDERDQLYKYLIDTDIYNSDDFGTLLGNYIDDKWEARRKNNICKKVGETISITKESLDETKQDLNCVIDTEKVIEELKIVFKVSNDDFFISEIDNYDTLASDGVHLLLCGTEQYSYNSIFFFPKEIDGEIRVIVCDVLNNRNEVLCDNLIKAEFSKTDENYIITATLSNKFIEENHLTSYFYMGIVISDCSSETHRRKNQLILSEEDSQWFNPTYFAKIDMEYYKKGE